MLLGLLSFLVGIFVSELLDFVVEMNRDPLGLLPWKFLDDSSYIWICKNLPL